MIVKNILMTTNDACRICGGARLTKVFAFGPTPPANAFLKASELAGNEQWFPLDVYFCRDCSLVQMRDIVSPELLFRNYVYVSSTSPIFIQHFKSFAESVSKRLRLKHDSLVVDIGSNDGILLKPFRQLGMRVLGVDPAEKIASQATADGISTVPEFFTEKLAKKIAAEHGRASVVTGTNVFAHVNDLSELLSGVKQLLGNEGVFIVEVPYLVDFMDKNLFDTVYHEHLSYFSVHSLSELFKRKGMSIFAVERVGSHGGSIRVFAQMAGGIHAQDESVDDLLALEEARKVGSLETYKAFAEQVENNRSELTRLLRQIKSEKKKIVGYGAPAKGNTLLNFFKIGPEILDYIVDDSEWKQGLFTPGARIPVSPASRLDIDTPDYVFILAWNYAEPIMKKLEKFRSAGVKFIVPVPKPHIL